ncbi:MAG: metal-dependent transcriptional regulator, partial [Chloroflexota bacterium]
DEAERIEHVISEDIEDRMAAALGYPTLDPHGSPIPGKDGDMVNRQMFPLTKLEIGQSAVIAEVYDENAQLLRYLGELGLYPDEIITLISKEPFNGPLKIKLEASDCIQTVGQMVAEWISVMAVIQDE